MRIQGPVGARTLIDGRLYDYFSGTGYLGLQNHPQVIAAASTALQTYGISTASSRGGLGEHPLYDEFEQAARAFFECEKSLYFASGYMGARILTQSESRANDHIFIDDNAHYSLWDAAQACGVSITPFRHLDPDALKDAISTELMGGERPLVMSDGLFPISGEIAPLPDYLEVMENFGGKLIVDDAHALGVLGGSGRGTADEFMIESDACLTCASLAKAMGGFGGIIWGKTTWIDKLEQASSFCIGASPPPLVVTAASAAGLRLAKDNPSWRVTLRENARLLREGLRELGINVAQSPSPIISIASEPDMNLEHIKDCLFREGIAVSLVRGYSSTPPGGALRIAVFATHQLDQISRLILVIKSLI